ncbi:MAG TPA: DnaJ domain-containing protein [Clostridiaceae bacterium]
MRNPYEVLEVKEGSTKDEIKKAYHDMAKKYHPDQYESNPLKELAEEKMREVNEAYDSLMKGGSSAPGNDFNSGSYNNSEGSSYATVRGYIQNGNIAQAEAELSRSNTKDAEWNYLMGIVYLRKGWYDNAQTSISTACSMDPMNFEYRQALNSLSNRNNGYRQSYSNRNGGDSDMCDMCIKIWCLQSICECLCQSC